MGAGPRDSECLFCQNGSVCAKNMHICRGASRRTRSELRRRAIRATVVSFYFVPPAFALLASRGALPSKMEGRKRDLFSQLLSSVKPARRSPLT